MEKTKRNYFLSFLKFFLAPLIIILVGIVILNWDKFAKIEEVKLIEVDCTQQANLLKEVYNIDQKIRNTDIPFLEFVKADHRNLEVVVSIIEKCGMPTLNEVDPMHMQAIWLTLQHSQDPKYLVQYFPLIEEAVRNGDMNGENLALMKDRILMIERKPQIYGSQIVDGKLYKLEEPELVNSRREIMGMQPIEAYLEFYNIEFGVEQIK